MRLVYLRACKTSPETLKLVPRKHVFIPTHTGTVWAGTENGLGRLDYPRGVFTTYYERNGLAGNTLNSILPLVFRDREAACRTVVRLTELLRLTLLNEGRDTLPLTLPSVLSRGERQAFLQAQAQIEAARATAFQQNMRAIMEAVWGQVATSNFASSTPSPPYPGDLPPKPKPPVMPVWSASGVESWA